MAKRPLPQVTPVTRFYWEAGAEGVLKVLRCEDCARWIHPPQPLCPVCLSERVMPQEVAGTGTVYSVTVNHQPWMPDLPIPYAIARIALDGVDDVLITSNVVGPDAIDARIGDRVRVRFEEQEGVWIPLFDRTEAGEA